MPQQPQWVDHVSIKVGGANLSHELMDVLVDVVVDTSLHMPAMFTMRFRDEQLRRMNDNTFELGATVEIGLAAARARQQRVISGEITAIEPEFNPNHAANLTVRGYDRSHRLNRGTQSKVYIQVTDSDMVSQIADAAGLQPEMDSTSEIYNHVFQHNQTDLAFLHERAERIGYEVYVDNTTLYFRQPRGDRGEVSLEWGTSLRAFYPRLTLAGQVDEVIVKGWDPVNKREITGQASRSETAPQVNVGGGGGQLAARAFSSARQMVVRQLVASQRDADAVAQSVLDQINAGFIEAEGIAVGDPQILAGKKLSIESVGTRFSGTYMVTSASHIYTADGYEVHFRVEGARPKTMADLMQDAGSQMNGNLWSGVVPAVVTNNQDPDGMSRVKLKFPWLDDSLESEWARLSAVGAGAERGLMWMPEVNDEVLVAFEHGDFNRPYVMGNLWNGQDAAPEDINNVVKGGNVEIRLLKTRTGHTIKLVDESSSSHIEIVDADGVNSLKLDMQGRKLIIKSQGEVSIESQGETKINASGNLSIKGSANVSVEASGQLTLKGSTVNIN